jgi:hypothetical protein
MADLIILDIETVPAPQRIEPPESVIDKGTGNLKDPAKIEAKKAANRENWFDRAPLDWRLGQIVAAGVVNVEGDEPETITQDPLTEPQLIEWTWERIGRSRVVGFGVRFFDLPFLLRRSTLYGITPPREFGLAKYRSPATADVIDWCEWLSNWGEFGITGWSLSTYAELYRLPTEPYGDGAGVSEHWLKGDYEYVIKHLESDLLMIRDLHMMCASVAGVK